MAAAMAPDPIPENFSLATPGGVNARSPGSGTENGSLGESARASEPFTGIRRGDDLAASRIAGLDPRDGVLNVLKLDMDAIGRS